PRGGTVLNLALCYEQLGKTASAWTEFKHALAVARKDNNADRVALAEQHIAALEPTLSLLTVDVVGAVPGVVVKRDGVVLANAAWGTAVPVDPGAVVVTAEAPGYQGFRGTITIAGAGQRARIVVPALIAEAAPRPSWRRPVGVVLASAGVVAMGIGVGFG